MDRRCAPVTWHACRPILSAIAALQEAGLLSKSIFCGGWPGSRHSIMSIESMHGLHESFPPLLPGTGRTSLRGCPVSTALHAPQLDAITRIRQAQQSCHPINYAPHTCCAYSSAWQGTPATEPRHHQSCFAAAGQIGTQPQFLCVDQRP